MKVISTDKAPAAIGPYSQGMISGNMVYSSGQIPVDPATNELVKGDISQQTHQVMQNIITILDEMNLRIDHIVKTTVFLSDMKNFAAMNEVYAQYFEEPYPARSCVQVGALPKGADVEIECLVIDTLRYEQGCSGSCSDCRGCE